MSIKGGQLPADDAMKPFYVLGVNIALQVGGELKTMLSKEELDLCIKGFTDSMTGTAGDEKGEEILLCDIHLFKIINSLSLRSLICLDQIFNHGNG